MPRKKKKKEPIKLTREEEIQMINEFMSVIKVTRETEAADTHAFVGGILLENTIPLTPV